jgi:hypothetical protein
MAKDTGKELTSDDKFEMLLEALTRQQTPGIDLAALKEVLQQTSQATANAMQKAMKPENTDHPGVSAFSYPEGDQAKPKAIPKHEFWYCGYPVHLFPETEHWREIELMAAVVPGEYTVLRKDGTTMAVTVLGERNADGKLTKVQVQFPVSREDKWLIPPKSVLLYQIVHRGDGSPKRVFLSAMQEHLALSLGEELVSA